MLAIPASQCLVLALSFDVCRCGKRQTLTGCCDWTVCLSCDTECHNCGAVIDHDN